MISNTLSMRFFWSFLFSLVKWHWKKILLVQLFYLGWSLDRSVLPYLIGKIIDGMTQYTGSRTEAWHILGQPILFTLSAWIGFDLSFRLGGLLFAKLIPKIESDARMTLYDQVFDHSHQYFVENMAGNVANKVAALPDSLRYILSSLMGSIIPASITLLIAMDSATIFL